MHSALKLEIYSNMAKKFLARFKPRVSDVFDCVQPLYMFCRILGLTNFKIVRGIDRRMYKTALSVLAREIIQNIVIVCLTYLEVTKDAGVNFFKRPFSQVILNIEIYSSSILSTGSTIIGIVFRKKIVSILNRINDIDIEFKKLDVSVIDWYVYIHTYVDLYRK